MQIAKKGLAILLAMLMVFSTFAVGGAGLALTALAAETGKAIRLVTNGAAGGVLGAQASSVWFGNYKQSKTGSNYNVDPIKWRVLSNADGELFLLSDQNLDVVRYNEKYASVTWADCTLRKWLNGYGGNPYSDTFIGSAFSEKELSAVADSALENANNPKNGINGGDDTTDKVFLLSIAEATNAAYGFTNDDARVSTNTGYVANGGHTGGGMWGVGEAGYWWLRSPGDYDGSAAIVSYDGVLYISGFYVYTVSVAVRPALNVDLGKVLFTSPAVGGKTGDGLTAVGSYDGTEWKLTLLDESRSDFTASFGGAQDDVYTIRYSGATTGENEKISAMIVTADGVATYYGVLGDARTGENTVTVDLAGKLHDGDKLYVFNEQVNGNYKTDYSSALVDVRPIVMPDLTVNKADLKTDLNTSDARTIWYGGTRWRVIGYDGAGAASESGTMTLFADGSMGTSYFDFDGKTGRQYAGSDLEKQTNQIYNNAFSDPEQLAVRDRTLNAGAYDGANTDGVEGSSVGYARLWPLSTREANAVNADLRKDSGDWWLRSPGDGDNNVGFVTKQGNVDHSGRSFRSELGVRPAFYVDLDRVIFASAAVGGKQGDGALTPIDGYHGNEWKLTVWEGNHRWFTVNETDVTAHPGGTVTLHYQYAATGENEYISAIVTDENGKALYYGRIAPATTEDGTVRITIPADLEKGSFSLYVFNEQVNGDKQTDYASELIEVVKPDVVKAADLRTGDTFFMGSYPQSRVTDEDLIAALSAVDCTMTSYGYVKNYKYADNSFQTIDMTYADIAYRGGVYRKVTINETRPSMTSYDSSYTYQPGHGYISGETYYFKWEPIEWQTLSNGSDGVYVMSVSVLDSQPVHHHIEYNLLWERYMIRSWLNDGFYNAAFSAGEQENVLLYTHDNKYFKAEYPQNDDPDTRDRVWLLSKLEAENADYGFTDDASRIAAGTDYAYSQGLRAGYWWLRTRADGQCQTWYVMGDGEMDGTWPGTDCITTCYGIRPVFMLDPDAVILPPDNTVVPDMTVTAETVAYGEDAAITATLPDDATGTVDFTLTGGAEDYTFYGVALNAGQATTGGQLKIGTYTVTASYSGDSRYKPATAETTLTVKPLVTPDMTLEAESVTYGEECDVTVTLPDDATGTVSFKLTGKDDKNTYTYDDVALSGGKAELHEKLNADDYETVVTYSGDNQYAAAEEKISFVVEKAPTELDVTTSPDTLVYGDTLHVTVTLSGGAVFSADQTDEQTGEPAHGPGSVTISVDGKEYRTVTVDPDDVTIVLDGNVATLEVNGLTAGQHNIEAVFVGDGNYKPSAADAMVDIGMAIPEMTIAISPPEPYVEETVTITATLFGGATFAGSATSGDGATLYVDGSFWYSASSGTDTVSFTVYGVPYGIRTVKVVYNGDANHAACEIEQSFYVSQYDPQLSVSAEGTTCDQEVVITATLADGVEGTVDISLVGNNNNYYFDSVPISGGKAEVVTTVNADDYTIYAEYSGDSKYAADTATATLSIDKAPSEITVSTDKQTYTAGDNVTVTITIPDDAEQPAGAAGNVTLKLDGQELTSIKVENGTGTYTIPSVGKGDHTVTATFNGDSHYAASEATATFSVDSDPDQNAADAVMEKIDAIGEVEYTDESKQKIDDARDAYDDLTDAQKDLVTNYDTLTDAEAKYTLLEARATCAQNGHKYVYESNDDGTHNVSCEVCDYAQENVGCDYDETVHPANCTSGQYSTFTCPKCHYSYDGPQQGDPEHTFGDEGEARYTCTQCGEVDEARKTQALADDMAEFEQYKEAQKDAADERTHDGDSDEAAALIENAKKAIDAVTYDETKSLDENKAAVDAAANLTQLDKDLADQRAADAVEDKIDAIGDVELTKECKDKIDDAREAYNDLTDEQKDLVDNIDTLTDAEAEYELLDNKAQFEEYKDELQRQAEDKKRDGDSAECRQLIEDAKTAIDNVTYDETKSLDENKQAVDEAANLAQLDADLAQHREIYYAEFIADGKPIESVPYTIDTKSITEPAVPAKIGYTGSWPAYTLTAGGVTVNAVYTLIGNPSIRIADYKSERTVLFHNTSTYTADAVDVPEGAAIHWFVNGEDVGTGDTFKVEYATEDYTIQTKIVSPDGEVFAESEVENVRVLNCRIVRLIVYVWEMLLSLVFHLSLPELSVFSKIWSLIGA